MLRLQLKEVCHHNPPSELRVPESVFNLVAAVDIRMDVRSCHSGKACPCTNAGDAMSWAFVAQSRSKQNYQNGVDHACESQVRMPKKVGNSKYPNQAQLSSCSLRIQVRPAKCLDCDNWFRYLISKTMQIRNTHSYRDYDTHR